MAFSVLDPRRWFRPDGRRSAPVGPSFVPVVEVLEDRTALTTFTLNSPVGKLPAFVSRVGGIVLDMVGENGQRIVSQLPPDALFLGMFDSGDPAEFQGNPGTIGVQTGFTPALRQALGGGLSELAVRITLFDGDTGTGDFDLGENRLLLNGVDLGDFSDVFTQETSDDGRTALSNNPDGGFRNDRLDTGFFHTRDPAVLDAFFATLSGGKVAYQLSDVDPFENFFDFTQGLAPGTVGDQPPTVVSPTDRGAEPAPEAPVPVPLLPPPPGSPDVAPLLIALLAAGPVAVPPSAPPVPAAVPAASGGAASISAAVAAVRPGALLPGSQATDAVEAAIQTASAAAVGPSLTRAATAAARALATAGDAAIRAVTGAIDQALALLEDGLALARAARAAARAAEPIMPAALGPAPGDVEVSDPPPVAVTQPQPAAPVTQTILMLLSALVVFRRSSNPRTRSGLRRHRSKAPGASGDRPRDGPGGTPAPRP